VDHEDEELNYYYNKFKFGEDYISSTDAESSAGNPFGIYILRCFYLRTGWQAFGTNIWGVSPAKSIHSPQNHFRSHRRRSLQKLKEHNFDLVITMMRIGEMGPFELARK
jgi:hypothetical protein